MSVQQPYYAPPLVRPTSGMAVAGFLLSLFGISVVGLVVSAVAMKHTGSGERGGHGLAVAGVVIGILGTIVWSLLVMPWLWVALFGTIGAASS